MAFGGVTINLTRAAGRDLSSHQYYCVRLSENDGRLQLSNWVSGGLGVLLDKPVTGQAGAVQVIGQCKAYVSGHFNTMMPLAVSEGGVLVSSQVTGDTVIAYALEAHASDTPSAIDVFLVGPGRQYVAA